MNPTDTRGNENAALIADFERWLAGAHAHGDETHEMVGYLRTLLDATTEPTYWTSERAANAVEEAFGGEEGDPVIASQALHALGDFVHYLADTRQLDLRSDDAEDLTAVIHEMSEEWADDRPWRISLPMDFDIPAVLLRPLDGVDFEQWRPPFEERLAGGLLVGFDDDDEDRPMWAEMLDSVAADLLVVLYVRGQLDYAEYEELAWTVTAGTLTKRRNTQKSQIRSMREEVVVAARQMVDELVAVGILTHDASTNMLRLTPLGTWEANGILVDAGYRAPTFTEVDKAAPADLLEAWSNMRIDDAEAALADWVACHSTDEVIALSSLIADPPDPLQLSMFADALDLLADDDPNAVKELGGKPTAGPNAASWLFRRGLSPSPIKATDLPSIVDTIATLRGADRMDQAWTLLATIGGPKAQAQVVESLWRLDHPQTTEVLTLLSKHPDKTVAKTARRAEFKRRSAGLE